MLSWKNPITTHCWISSCWVFLNFPKSLTNHQQISQSTNLHPFFSTNLFQHVFFHLWRQCCNIYTSPSRNIRDHRVVALHQIPDLWVKSMHPTATRDTPQHRWIANFAIPKMMPYLKGDTCSKPWFSVFMLIFGGVSRRCFARDFKTAIFCFFYFSKGKCLVPGLDLTLLHRVPKISKNGSKQKCYVINIDDNSFSAHSNSPVRLRCSAQKDPIDKLESKMRNWRNLFHQDLNISTPHPKDTTKRTYVSLVGDISFLAPMCSWTKSCTTLEAWKIPVIPWDFEHPNSHLPLSQGTKWIPVMFHSAATSSKVLVMKVNRFKNHEATKDLRLETFV